MKMDACRDILPQEAAALLSGGDRILLLCHQKPDGDTLGSGFALCYALQALGKQVRIESPGGFPERYRFLYPGFDPEAQPAFVPELIVAVDVADAQLLGKLCERYADRIDLCIDHHLSNRRYAKALLLDAQAAGTVSLVEQVIDALGAPIAPLTAACIFTGLSTDTGCFRYSNTTPDTHRTAARMMELGADAYTINRKMFGTKSTALMEMERLVLDTLEFHWEKRLAVVVVSTEMLEKTGILEEEMMGIAGIPRQIEGVELAITLQQKAQRLWRVSVRTSQRINASALCEKLGGGGHVRAAGCTLQGDLAACKAQMLAVAADYF